MKVKLAKTAGFCMGVRRALELVLSEANKGQEPIFAFGPLIHNEQVMELLASKGVTVVEDVAGLKEESYAKVLELTRRFEEQFGTTSCRTMTGCDLLSPEGRADYQQNQIAERVCRPAVKSAVRAVAEICR